jgi:flagellar biosynthesis protein FlhG
VDRRRNITAILGPKGGVGKSTISANLAIALSRMGKKVVAVDLDLGASNLHAIFGMRGSHKSLSDFTQKRVKKLADVVLKTPAGNVGIICGGDDPGIANMSYQKKIHLIRHLASLNCDQVLLDMAPGASHNVVDFSIIAQQSLLVTTAEVPSLLNVYSFIKSALYRRLTFFFKRNKCSELLALLDQAAESEKHPQLKTMEGFFREARKINAGVADSAKKILTRIRPLVVVNRVRTGKDARAGEVIKNLLKEYLSIESAVTMTIRDDDAVGNAIAKLSPIMIDAPDSPFSSDLQEIAARL